jgi:alkylhydroperoxidase family enzyme
VNDIDRIWRIDSKLRALRPDASSLLDLANMRAWVAVQPVILELIRLNVGALIGNQAGLARRSRTARAEGLTESKIAQLGYYYKSSDFSAVEMQILSFAESFVIDVSSITEGDVAGLGKYFSAAQLNELVVALYVTECTQRLEMLVPALVGGSPNQVSDSGAAADQESASTHEPACPEDLVAALDRYQEAVVLGTALDPVVTEMVRLRCARTHDCRICKTLRLVDARQAGVDDAMTAKIDFYEKSDLDERIKIALRITDAFVTRPDTLGESVIHQARSTFTPEALAELCLDITKWSTQKIYVAQGTDGAHVLPKNEQGVSFFSFDESGKVVGFSATP